MQVHGSPDQSPMSEVGATRMSVSQFFKECKSKSMSTPEAVLSSIKYAFSNSEGKAQKLADLSPKQQSASTQQVASQRAAEPNSAPKFTMEDTLGPRDWKGLCDREVSKGRNEGNVESPREAAKYVMDELKKAFPDHEIQAICYLPRDGSERSLVVGVKIMPTNDPFGEPRCIHVRIQTHENAGGDITRITSDSFLKELNKLN